VHWLTVVFYGLYNYQGLDYILYFAEIGDAMFYP
jgi:hypothetical protein